MYLFLILTDFATVLFQRAEMIYMYFCSAWGCSFVHSYQYCFDTDLIAKPTI